jgi:pyruvate,orthophosphate dikinase
VQAELDTIFEQFMQWVDAARRLRVRANADTPEDARTSRASSERRASACAAPSTCSFREDRIDWVRRMILADSREARLAALEKILPMQREDFEACSAPWPICRSTSAARIRRCTSSCPANRRRSRRSRSHRRRCADAASQGPTPARFNPMLGHRGCRLGITFPRSTRMQVRAIMEAAVRSRREGITVKPRSWSRWSVCARSFALAHMIVRVADGVMAEAAPRALHGGHHDRSAARGARRPQIAEVSDFFSFGTNDLTQMTFGFSRDDAPSSCAPISTRMCCSTIRSKTIDIEGVGQLVRMATENGAPPSRASRWACAASTAAIPRPVHFFPQVGLDYVSCSPFRVPVARVAAAQARAVASRLLTDGLVDSALVTRARAHGSSGVGE